jgi:hypothetical protein
MKKIEAILLCYGKVAIKQEIEIKVKEVIYSSWMITGIKTRKKLKKSYSKKQIIAIYESAI